MPKSLVALDDQPQNKLHSQIVRLAAPRRCFQYEHSYVLGLGRFSLPSFSIQYRYGSVDKYERSYQEIDHIAAIDYSA